MKVIKKLWVFFWWWLIYHGDESPVRLWREESKNTLTPYKGEGDINDISEKNRKN